MSANNQTEQKLLLPTGEILRGIITYTHPKVNQQVLDVEQKVDEFLNISPIHLDREIVRMIQEVVSKGNLLLKITPKEQELLKSLTSDEKARFNLGLFFANTPFGKSYRDILDLIKKDRVSDIVNFPNSKINTKEIFPRKKHSYTKAMAA